MKVYRKDAPSFYTCYNHQLPCFPPQTPQKTPPAASNTPLPIFAPKRSTKPELRPEIDTPQTG